LPGFGDVTISTQKEKVRDRENDALHLCVCQSWIVFSEDDVQASRRRRKIASVALQGFLDIKRQVANRVLVANALRTPRSSFGFAKGG
jgi:hypothetical protein